MLGMLGFVHLVERTMLLQDDDILAAMALARCHESQCVVARDFVVSVNEPGDDACLEFFWVLFH